jgi:putative membrane protein
MRVVREDPMWTPYCGEAPSPEVWLSRWNLEPVLGTMLVLLAMLLWHPAAWQDAASVNRRRALQCAWALTVLLYVSPLCALSSAFFTVRVVHHMVLVLAVAPLLALGMAPWLRRLPAPLCICAAAAALVFWTWHTPALYAVALSSVPAYALMQLTILVSAVGFWAAVQRAEPAGALAAILATMVSMGLLGALITFAQQPLYEPHFASTLAWNVAPLEDQQRAGIVMWAPGSFAYLFAALWIVRRWMRRERNGGLRAQTP